MSKLSGYQCLMSQVDGKPEANSMSEITLLMPNKTHCVQTEQLILELSNVQIQSGGSMCFSSWNKNF